MSVPLGIALGILSWCSFAGAAPPQDVMQIEHCTRRVDALRSDPPLPPARTLPRAPVVLPDPVGRRLPNARGVAWYRCSFPIVDSKAPRALYLPHVHPNFVVYLNGSWLGQGGRFFSPEAHTWNHPAMYTLNERYLLAGENVLEIGVPLHGSVFHQLGSPWIGSAARLAREYEAAHWLRVRSAEISTTVSLVALVLFSAFGLALRDGSYLYLAAAALGCAGNSLNFHWRAPGLSYWRFEVWVNVAITVMITAFGLFSLRLMGLRSRHAELAAGGFLALVALAACWVPGPSFERHLLLVHAPGMALCVFGFALMVLRHRYLARAEWATAMATAALLVPIGIHDVVLQYDRQRGHALPSAELLTPLVGPLTLIGFGAVLLTRFLRVSRAAQRANQALAEQVEQKRLELEAEYARVESLMRERAVLEERGRLQREMHDGIGAHLVTMLAMSEGDAAALGPLRETARAALDEMRLMVRSMDPGVSDLTALLADMRARLTSRLSHQGLRFVWEVSELPTPNRLTRSDLLEISRIVQESITNVLKHARATTVRVQTGRVVSGRDELIFIAVQDDGEGIDLARSQGRGISNMRTRAARLRADLRIERNERGTLVRLSLPLEMRS